MIGALTMLSEGTGHDLEPTSCMPQVPIPFVTRSFFLRVINHGRTIKFSNLYVQ